MTLPTVLKQLRKERGLEQKELAAVLNYSVGTISNYENGIHSPNLATLCALANYYGVSTDYLLGRTDFPYSLKILEQRISGAYTVKDMLKAFRRLPESDSEIIITWINPTRYTDKKSGSGHSCQSHSHNSNPIIFSSAEVPSRVVCEKDLSGTLPAILKNLREDKEIGQKELAAELNYSIGTISNYENGVHSPNLATLCTLADYFGVSTDYLLGHTDYPYSGKILEQRISETYTVNDLLNFLQRLPEPNRKIFLAFVMIIECPWRIPPRFRK